MRKVMCVAQTRPVDYNTGDVGENVPSFGDVLTVIDEVVVIGLEGTFFMFVEYGALNLFQSKFFTSVDDEGEEEEKSKENDTTQN
jgi:hypothetical protein